MSFTPYQCLHVPVQTARVRVFGVPAWVLPVVLLVVVVKLYGPWVILAPALGGLAMALAVAVFRATRRPEPGAGEPLGGVVAAAEQDNGSAGGVGLPLSGVQLVCLGCGRRPAAGLLEVAGYRLPFCIPCQGLAGAQLGTGQACGQPLPASGQSARPRGGWRL